MHKELFVCGQMLKANTSMEIGKTNIVIYKSVEFVIPASTNRFFTVQLSNLYDPTIH